MFLLEDEGLICWRMLEASCTASSALNARDDGRSIKIPNYVSEKIIISSHLHTKEKLHSNVEEQMPTDHDDGFEE